VLVVLALGYQRLAGRGLQEEERPLKGLLNIARQDKSKCEMLLGGVCVCAQDAYEVCFVKVWRVEWPGIGNDPTQSPKKGLCALKRF
jgi:hypothetical protein